MEPAEAITPALRARILDAARDQVRRFGPAKTNVVDIAKALGTSHPAIYRHFSSKAAIFDALAEEAMRDEHALALEIASGEGTAAGRLEELVVALQARKHARLRGDPEVYGLHRRIVQERPDIVAAYAQAVTAVVAGLLADGVARGEFDLEDVQAAAETVRDAVTVFIHPAHVEAAARSGAPVEADARRMVRTLVRAFARA